MVEIGTQQFGYSAATSLKWLHHQTLPQAVETHFQVEEKFQPDNPRLDRLFTARNLAHIGGITIKWTNNLVDHLLLTDDDHTVFIFHCASFLKFQQSFGDSQFPIDVLEETLRTLTLLFPQNDKQSRKWLQGSISADSSVDRALERCGSLRAHERRFDSFCIWHNRLVILKQAFDESSPRTLTQWWNDRRNSVQWYTFWVAILVFVMTVVFGLIQSVEGALQVWLSWKALQSAGG
ncbi:hypothetical protein GQ53DRAFT_639638 [Thozetella sp. PMI_491]|nr:hypothetical protein GQ53DRAFT_639638 [Thozetella sp. PMI_491]